MHALLRKYHNRENGFTLVELLIVVLIIGVLAAIAIPVYLGLQNQAKNNSAKQDTNSAVHSIQVALTEGQDLTTALNNNSDSGNRSDGNQVVATAALDGSKNYTVVGTQKDTQFTYTYDSKTGQFTEGTAAINLGGGSPSSPPPVNGNGFTATAENGDATNNNWQTLTGGAIPPTNTRAKTGSNSIALAPANGVTYYAKYLPGTALQSNKTYTYSYWVYNPGSARTAKFGYTSGYVINQTSISPNVWTQITGTFTTGTYNPASDYFFFNWDTASTANTYYVDDFTMTAN